ncbi:MAG: NAD(P)-binding domain-containing protein [Vitreoscilla sp.]|nr:NAD(P)-binding domain-containing protein [Vitreoscilla sp.]
MSLQLFLPYAVGIALFLVWHILRRGKREKAHKAEFKENLAAGLMEPPSLHPVVNPALCIGSGTCVKKCPEEALGMVGGKAVLINASACIGHGACHSACPFDAITLVFGTEKRGIDIPLLSHLFETNLHGIFIAGELGGMGLIRKAAEQGTQVVEAIIKRMVGEFPSPPDMVDLLIVGAGPAGMSASLSAKLHKLKFRIIEQEHSLGGAIFKYPRQKIAMTAPVKLAMVGLVKMHEISKEDLLEFWEGTRAKHDITIDYNHRMERIEPFDGGFFVHTNQGAPIKARAVLLAIGRQGTPRTLDVPGENTPKVAYRLIDPHQYEGQKVLVVGGGDSALEAAIALGSIKGITSVLSYRSAAFSRVKGKNRDTLAKMQAEGTVDVRLQTQVLQITEKTVVLKNEDGSTSEIDNDQVIVCAGGVLPTPLLKDVGIKFETKFGTV